MDTLWKKQSIVTRVITGENPTGEKGKAAMAEPSPGGPARELGKGWKCDPFTPLPAKKETTIAHIRASGIIKHIWMGLLDHDPNRNMIIRFYWDGCQKPAVEVPFGDFFASANIEYWQINSLLVCRNPRSGYNTYFEMPFRNECKVTIENLSDKDRAVAYEINLEEREVPDDMLYFHGQFFRANPQPYKEEYPILDTIYGKGCYIGTYMTYGITNNGWWGEGEIKFYIDGDKEYPSICGTGTEDYFCGSWNFDVNGKYINYSSPYSGFYSWENDSLYKAVKRFSMYRWHITDPVYFENDLRIDIQLLGWRNDCRYLPLQSSDVSSVAYFYLDAPYANARPLLDADGLEII